MDEDLTAIQERLTKALEFIYPEQPVLEDIIEDHVIYHESCAAHAHWALGRYRAAVADGDIEWIADAVEELLMALHMV